MKKLSPSLLISSHLVTGAGPRHWCRPTNQAPATIEENWDLLSWAATEVEVDRLAELHQLLPEAMERYRVARNFKPPGKKERAPQFEPDSFSMGREQAHRSEPQWLAVEDGTTIFSSPNTQSHPLATLKRNDPLTVGYQTEDWFEVNAPVKGYVLGAEIYRKKGERPSR
jgi:hypothetical protein